MLCVNQCQATKITELNYSAISGQLALDGPSRQVAHLIYLRTVELISSVRNAFVFRTCFAPINIGFGTWSTRIYALVDLRILGKI